MPDDDDDSESEAGFVNFLGDGHCHVGFLCNLKSYNIIMSTNQIVDCSIWESVTKLLFFFLIFKCSDPSAVPRVQTIRRPIEQMTCQYVGLKLNSRRP